MNTDRLTELLSANVEPVSRGKFERALVRTIAISAAAAFGLMLASVGPRRDPTSPLHLEWVVVKLLFALSVVGFGTPALIRSARPGFAAVARYAAVLFPLLAMIMAALIMLCLTSSPAWTAMLRGATDLSAARCLICIIVFAAIPFAALFRALRDGAPTRPAVCGAIAGLVAGGVGAAAYALACNSDSAPFIAIWYGAALGVCAILGAVVGPRTLRW